MKKYLLLLLIVACKHKPAAGPAAQIPSAESKKIEPRYRYELKEGFLIIGDRQRKVFAKLELELDEYSRPELVDMTDSLQFHNLLLQLMWDDRGDVRSSQFFEFKNDSIHSLFSIDNLNSIKRKDANTLVGFVSSRDEVVSTFQDDYPFTVSLLDNKVNYVKPEVQCIGWTSDVLEDLNAYRIGPANDTIPVTLKKGTEIELDSLYRGTGIIRLLIKNSPPAFIKVNRLKGKINELMAG